MNKIIRSVKITGTGSYTPERIITNSEIALKGFTSDEWIYKNLGIRERHVVEEGELTSDLAVKAALKAIDAAELTVDDIDLIILATTTPDRLAPSTACIVQEKLGAFNAAAFDISAVCSGFIYAFSVGAQFIASGAYKNVLIIGADTFSKITKWDRRDCVFFGDGSGAAILSTCSNGDGLLNFVIGANGKGKDNFTIRAGGFEEQASIKTINEEKHYFTMNGKAVFDTAINVIPKAVKHVLKESGLCVGDVDYLIPHQPSINILKVSAERIGLPFEKVMTNMDKYANTSSATVPIILDETLRSGKIKKGNIIVLAAVGSGWTWGAAVLRWV